MAKSLPLTITDGSPVTPLATLVAGAIKPTESIGSATAALLQNKPTDGDYKVVIIKPAAGGPAVIAIFPADMADADILTSVAHPLTTLGRDDVSRQASPHSANNEDGTDANAVNVAIAAAIGAAKPSRSMPGLLNAISDAVDGVNDGAGYDKEVAIIVDQSGAGSVKVYEQANGLDGDALAAAAAVVEQGAEEASPTVPSLW